MLLKIIWGLVVVLFIILGIIILAIALACDAPNCDDQMAAKKRQHGTAEEVVSYSTTGYHSIDWWYWSQGFQYSFTWGDHIGGCDVSKYTFEPIHISDATLKMIARRSKVLVEQYNCPDMRRMP